MCIGSLRIRQRDASVTSGRDPLSFGAWFFLLYLFLHAAVPTNHQRVHGASREHEERARRRIGNKMPQNRRFHLTEGNWRRMRRTAGSPCPQLVRCFAKHLKSTERHRIEKLTMEHLTIMTIASRKKGRPRREWMASVPLPFRGVTLQHNEHTL